MADFEIFVPVAEFPAYAVSNKGRVKRVTANPGSVPGRILRPGLSSGYAYVGLRRIDAGESIVKNGLIHRLVATAFIPNPHGLTIVDHIDGDKSNNDVSNLRWCTRQQNSMNMRPHRRSLSRFKGVCFSKEKRRWQASIRLNGKSKFLGYFNDDETAARAYDAAAGANFGRFAKLNFPPSNE